MQTTLILGAGASAPYKFPTGFELTQKILALEGNIELLIYFSDQNTPLVRKFFQSFRMSTATSIDSFVAKNPRYTEIARTAIAMVLMEMEDHEVFFNHTIVHDYGAHSNQYVVVNGASMNHGTVANANVVANFGGVIFLK